VDGEYFFVAQDVVSHVGPQARELLRHPLSALGLD
jgi:hypothetical protein